LDPSFKEKNLAEYKKTMTGGGIRSLVASPWQKA
jgi:hypothetical protein